MGFLNAIAPDWQDAVQDLNVIDEAMTHTSAGLSKNHERLEFLGDGVTVILLSVKRFI